MIVIRVLASLCAFGLVGAFAIAALLPPEMDLASMLAAINANSLIGLHDFLLHNGASGIWKHILLPFLLRPGWLLPVMIGVIAGGIAFSVNQAGPTRQSTRRSG